MRVFKQKARWSDDNQKFHVIRESGWQDDTEKLQKYVATAFCGLERSIVKGDVIVEYVKKKHRKEVCEDCVVEIKKLQARTKPLPPVRGQE